MPSGNPLVAARAAKIFDPNYVWARFSGEPLIAIGEINHGKVFAA